MDLARQVLNTRSRARMISLGNMRRSSVATVLSMRKKRAWGVSLPREM